MSGFAVSNRVSVRSSLGTFINDVERSTTRTVERAIEEGAAASRALAPVGEKVDKRTLPLRDSIFTRMEGPNRGYWYSVARHALPIEYGARAHPIIGSPHFQFYWDAAGRWWIPGLMGDPDFIMHPGNAAQPFLRPAYEAVIGRRLDQIMREEYAR